MLVIGEILILLILIITIGFILNLLIPVPIAKLINKIIKKQEKDNKLINKIIK